MARTEKCRAETGCQSRFRSAETRTQFYSARLKSPLSGGTFGVARASFAAAMSAAELDRSAVRTDRRLPNGGRGADAASRPRVSSLLTGALLPVVLYAAFDHGAVALAGRRAAPGGDRRARGRGRRRLAVDRHAPPGRARASRSRALRCWPRFACWSGITRALERRAESDLDRAQPRDHVRARRWARDRARRFVTQRAIRQLAIGFLARRAGRHRVRRSARSSSPGCTSAACSTSTRPGRSRACRSRSATGTRWRCSSRWGCRSRLRSPSDARRGPRLRLASAGDGRADAADDRVHLLAGRGARARGRLWPSRSRRAASGCGRLMWLAAAVVATVPPLVFGLASHRLTTAGVSLSHRELAGAELALVLLASLAVLVVAGRTAAGGRAARDDRPRSSARAAPARALARRRARRDRAGRRCRCPRAGSAAPSRTPGTLHLDEGDQQHQPEPAAVGRLREPLGVVEGGRRGVQRPTRRRAGERARSASCTCSTAGTR